MRPFKALCCAMLLFAALPALSQRGWILYDSTVRQPFQRWEATADVGAMCDPHLAQVRDKLLDSLVAITGVNRLRVEVRSGAENPIDHYATWRAAGCPTGSEPAAILWRTNRYVTVNDNADTTIDPRGFHFTELDDVVEQIVLPLKRRLEAVGKDLHVNVCYVANTFENDSDAAPYIHDRPDEYAEFMVAVYKHLAERWAITPDVWEAVYEPDRIREWTADKLGAALQAAERRMNDFGYRPNFIVPSTSEMANAIDWTKKILAYQGVRSAVREMSYHRTVRSNDTVAWQIHKFADTNELSTSMLHSTADSTFPTVMIKDIEHVGANVWSVGSIAEQFDVATEGDSVKVTRTHGVARHGILSRFVVPGSLRVDNSRYHYAIVMRTPEGVTVGYENRFAGVELDEGWPTGSCLSIQIDSFAKERARRWVRTDFDSIYLQSIGIGRFLGIVFTIDKRVVSVNGASAPTQSSIGVSPQPARDELRLVLPATWDDQSFSVRLVDVQGREVYSSITTSKVIYPTVASGWYLMECRQGDAVLRTPCVME